MLPACVWLYIYPLHTLIVIHEICKHVILNDITVYSWALSGQIIFGQRDKDNEDRVDTETKATFGADPGPLSHIRCHNI